MTSNERSTKNTAVNESGKVKREEKKAFLKALKA